MTGIVADDMFTPMRRDNPRVRLFCVLGVELDDVSIFSICENRKSLKNKDMNKSHEQNLVCLPTFFFHTY